MRSPESLREFIAERLTAAAEDIFVVFKRTIVEYEEEIDRQCRLLDMAWKPHIYLQRTDVPQQHVFKEVEVVAEQQLCNQDRNSSLDQQEGEPSRIKENQEGEQVTVKQEMDTAILSNHSEGELQNEQQLAKNSVVAEVQDTKVSEHVTVGLTAYEEEMSVGEVEEIDGQHNIMDMVKKLHLHLNRIAVPQQHVHKEEEDVVEQQLCDQERNSSLDQEEPKPPQTKEKQKGEQLEEKQETDTIMLTDHSEGELQNEQQLLSKDFYVGGEQDTKVSKHVTVGLTAYEEEMSVGEVEEIDDQHNIMNMVKKLHIHLNRIDVPQQHVHKEEEVLAEQERNSSADQEGPEPSQEQTGEQLTVKQETDTAMVADHSEGELKNKCPHLSNHSQAAENQGTKVRELKDSESSRKTKQKKKHGRKLTKRINPKRKTIENDCNREQQLLPSDSHVGENQDAKGSEHIQEETTADEYKEIDRPCILLDIVRKPCIYVHRMDAPQQHVIKEKVVSEQQLCNQERNSSLDQEQPEPPLVKENQEGEQLEEKQETDTIMLTDHSDGEVKDKQQLFSNDSHVDENQDTKVSKHFTEGLSVYEEEMSVYVEKEIGGQHNMMHMAPTLHIHLRRTDVPQQHVFQEEEEVVAEQQLRDQDRISCLVQEDPELLPMKEEQKGEQEMDTMILTDHNERVLQNQPVKVSKQEESVLTRKSNPKRKKMFQERRNPKRKTSKNNCYCAH
ncbi:involucrin-like [Cheilinus undulatus]|uniref:involucrin-like n=1 Tax=Cheilinus undulatus TaxID=241271 RepID=UPI001BD54521|nr:involucrin-like [Cheilinus undulatus]